MSSAGRIALSMSLNARLTTRTVSRTSLQQLQPFISAQISPHNHAFTAINLNRQIRLKSSTATSSDSTTTPKTEDGFEDLDKPIKFTTSKAALWRALDTHGGGVQFDTPSYQPYVVTGSVAIFLLYFLVLREENDIDEEMKRPLWERVPSLERQQLETLIKYNREHNLPTQDLNDRLKIVKEKQIQMRKDAGITT